MKYRHRFHAGNFADVHKHIALLALLRALKRKDKGFLYLDTHAGRGSYDLSGAQEAPAGIERFMQSEHRAPELREYADLISQFRAGAARRHLYPGSPLIGASELRAQDRAVLIELQGAEAARRFPSGVLAAWYPIKDERDIGPWQAACLQALRAVTERSAVLASELWLYPRDSRVALNGSGLLLVNPPWLMLERMQVWLPELQTALAVGEGAGSSARILSESSR